MVLLELLATFTCALFAGAALYITLVEHPTRLKLETKLAAKQWVPSYAPAARMQAPLALVSFVAGAIVWLADADVAWLIAALLIGLVVPFTLLVIKPANDKLLEPDRDLSSRETRSLLERWGRLHAVRTVLAVFSFALYLWLLAR
ncbi:MAG: DUF1772 domain-containing protein [Steroidobacteraceae bacterium]